MDLCKGRSGAAMSARWSCSECGGSATSMPCRSTSCISTAGGLSTTAKHLSPSTPKRSPVDCYGSLPTWNEINAPTSSRSPPDANRRRRPPTCSAPGHARHHANSADVAALHRDVAARHRCPWVAAACCRHRDHPGHPLEVLFINVGSGGNGKSKFFTVPGPNADRTRDLTRRTPRRGTRQEPDRRRQASRSADARRRMVVLADPHGVHPHELTAKDTRRAHRRRHQGHHGQGVA